MAGISSNGSKLEHSATLEGTFTKLFPIKGVPSLIGKNKTLPTTTCDDTQETTIEGIKEATTPEFKGNYNSEEYAAAKALEGTSQYWKVTLPDGSTITWQGKVTMAISESGYDDVLEMTATITTETVPVWAAPTT